MTEPKKPSRFHASPAEIDAFLRENFAEDALLNFYRAAGDEVLDEAITHGRQHRGVMETRNCKHIYLAGMADVLDELWDFRYYPAKLPKLETYNRPFNPPRSLDQAAGFHPEDSTHHPQYTRLPSPKAPVKVIIREVPGGWDAHEPHSPSKIVATAVVYDDLEAKLRQLPMDVHVIGIIGGPVDDSESEHIHTFRDVASWPSGPNSTSTLRQCSCGESIEADTTHPPVWEND